MFNLFNFPTIISFLKNQSKIFTTVGNSEVVIHCPYCDDATRKRAFNHGHCYLSAQHPVWHCFRCESSGSLPRLLLDYGFSDDEVFKDLKYYINFKFKTDSYKNIINDKTKKTFNIDIHTKNHMFKDKHLDDFKNIEKYINKRIGSLIDYNQFGMVGGKLEGGKNCIHFINSNGERNVSRYITGNKRYKKYNPDLLNLYFFQKWNFDLYDNIVLAEGPFDIINLYLYTNHKKTFFISMNGKNYFSTLNHLLMTELLLGKYKIIYLFDNDVKNYKYIIKKSKILIDKLNSNIKIDFLLPLIGKDVGDFPATIT